MSEEQATTEASSQETSKTTPPARKGLSPVGALLAMILGAIIGAAAYYAVDERQDQQFVADVTDYFSGTLQETGPMMSKVLESMKAHNYGEAQSGLEEILTVWQRASNVEGMEEQWTLMDDLIAGLGIAAEKVGQLSEDAVATVEDVADKMRQMGINVPQPGGAAPAPPPEALPAMPPTQPAPAPAPPAPPAPSAPSPSGQ